MLSPGMLRSGELVDRGLLTGSLLLFIASAVGTVAWCLSMSMAWMPMPGESWFGAAAAFLGMWTLMMVAMMLPALLPALAAYRSALGERRPARPTLLVAAGYFSVWVALGVAVLPVGVGPALAAMRWDGVARVVPLAAGGLLILAGSIQLSPWKARLLSRCRKPPGCASVSPDAPGAWKHGMRLGAVCVLCCAGFTLTLLVLGVMDLRIMGLLAAAITLERLTPWPARVARVSGTLGIATGLLLLTGFLRLA